MVSPEADSCTFSGPNLLANGDSYTFTVTGTNADGTGVASAPSNGVTPSAVPDAPTGVVATAGNKTATVTWVDGSSEGSTTTSYTVTATDTSSPALDPNDGGETCTYTVVSPEVDSCTFSGPNQLANGDSYTFTVTGTNADGTGVASAPSNMPSTPSTVPDAPDGRRRRRRHPERGHGHVDSRLRRGLDDHLVHGHGDRHLVLAEASPQRRRRDLLPYVIGNPEVDSCTFSGSNLLTTGDSYTFTVTGTNANGTGAASAPSNSVTPPASAVSVSVSATPTTYSAAGTVITYTYVVTDSGSTTLHGVGVSDTVAGAASCPSGTLAVGASENCTGSYTITSADVVNGSVTDSATANALNPSDTPVSSTAASTTVTAATGLQITTTTLTPGQVKSVAYKVKLAATGGTAPYTWNLKTGPLPPGLTLSSNGKLAGTPTKKGTYTLTFRVTDSASPKGKATATLSLRIDQVVVSTKDRSLRRYVRSVCRPGFSKFKGPASVQDTASRSGTRPSAAGR